MSSNIYQSIRLDERIPKMPLLAPFQQVLEALWAKNPKNALADHFTKKEIFLSGSESVALNFPEFSWLSYVFCESFSQIDPGFAMVGMVTQENRRTLIATETIDLG